MAGRRDFDSEATVFDRVRRISALARFDPDAVAPATLADVLETVGGRYRRDVAHAIEHYAQADPAGIARHRPVLLTELDEYGGTAGAALARAVGQTVTVDSSAVDALVDRLQTGSRASEAADGIAVAADLDPEAVGDHLSALLDALAAGPAVREPLSRALAALYVIDATDARGPARPRIGRGLDAGDPDKRAGVVQTVCRAAAADCQSAIDEVHRVIHTLDGDGGFFVADDDLDAVVLTGTREVARTRPHALVPHLDALLDYSSGDDVDDLETDLEAIAADVVAASPPVFERLLTEVEPGDSWLARMRSVAADDSRARATLAQAAPAHVDVLIRREATVRTLLSEFPGLGADLVATVADRDPRAADWAIDPLLNLIASSRVDDDDAADRVASSVAVLGRTYPKVTETVIDRLATGDPEGRERAVLTIRALAELAPDAFAGVSGPEGTPVEELLAGSLTRQGQQVHAAYALAAMGAHDPGRVADIADHVANAVRTTSYESPSERNRAVNALAATTIPAAPDVMHSVGLTVLDQVAGRTNELLDPAMDSSGLVTLLGALCGEWTRYADRVIEWYETAPDHEAEGFLAVLAAASWREQTAMTDHFPTLMDATRRLDDDQRAAATTALAGAVAAADSPPTLATARLVDLVYDNSPAVRLPAVYGVGEWLASTGRTQEEPADRLRLVADADDGTPVAELALVRAGVQPARSAVDALARVGRGNARAPAVTAVDVLAGVDTPEARVALEGIREGADDQWVRAAAVRALR